MEEEITLLGILNEFLTGKGFWPVLLRMAVVLLITWVAAGLYKRLSSKVRQDKIYYRFIHNITIMLIYVAGIALMLSQLPNFDNTLEAVLAGSGIAALTIGLAAQEALGNAINGMALSISKPFEVGDRIRLINGNITGYVEDITLRHTVVRTFINSRVIIPNSAINKDMIENSNFLDGKASSFIDVTITYDSDMELAQQIMAEIIGGHPDYEDNRTPEEQDQPRVRVYIRNLGGQGVELRASMWTANVGNNFDACSDVRKAIKPAFEQAGIQFAYSTAFSPPPKEIDPDPPLS